MRRALLLLALLALRVPAVVAAQEVTLSKAFELERRGNYAAAADAYRFLLKAKPADVAALLGLERALLPMNRSAEVLPEVRSALAANPGDGAIYGVALRAFASADQPDSMRAVAERWAQASPGDETPYREWGAAALGRRDRPGALRAYLRGRERLHRPDALAAEMAQLAAADGDFTSALREWLPAVRQLPGYRVTAVATLSQAPDSSRAGLLRQIAAEQDFAARRLEADLRARWGDPLGGVRVLEAALPADRVLAIDALRGLLDQLRRRPTHDTRMAQGRILEAIAERSAESERARIRLDAARAYTAAGEREAARRMLVGIADDRTAPGTIAAGASTTLIEVLIVEGKLDEASRRLAERKPSINGTEYAALQRRVAAGWLAAGDVARAAAALESDSTVEGLALAGRIRLYQGDIAGAIERFKAAGPFAGDRAEATERTGWLAMLQPIEADSLPALGQALLLLARGDTARAVASLDAVAGTLPADKGGAEVRLLAGRLAAAIRQSADAERLFREAAAAGARGTAPAAELALAELMLEQHRPAEAKTQLEHLILTYPGSALVPQARRRLDQARGAVPRT